MKKKSLFTTLFVTIILISSCIVGVAKNESASVTFKIEIPSATRNTTTNRLNTVEKHYIITSIENAETKKVIASQTLPIDATSCTFAAIKVGLIVIGKVEFFYGNNRAEKTLRSLPFTITSGKNNIIVQPDNTEEPDGTEKPDSMPIYVSPTGGDDNNSGTETSPVKTIEKAITILSDSDGGNIWIMNTIEVSTSTSLNGNSNVTLKRYGGNVNTNAPAHLGALINVTGGTLTLENITIDGQGGVKSGNFIGEGSVVAEASLIMVETNGTLQLNDGTILQNNNNSRGAGGSVNNRGNLVMTGGTISNNTAAEGGGGIYSLGTFTLGAGGTINISGNKKSDNSVNNIAYDAGRAPIKVTGSITVATKTTIGLSPLGGIVEPTLIVVALNNAIIIPAQFSLDTAAGTLSLSNTDLLVTP